MYADTNTPNHENILVVCKLTNQVIDLVRAADTDLAYLDMFEYDNGVPRIIKMMQVKTIHGIKSRPLLHREYRSFELVDRATGEVLAETE